jgi:glycosyltransferase involved in cell wall biosynthesis
MAWLERYVISQADSVLFTSDHTLEAYRQAYPEMKTKGVVLYNGVEESDFVAPSDTSVPFVFTYVGTLHGFQAAQIELFLRAFALAARSENELAESEIRICGYRPIMLDSHISNVAHELGIEHRVKRWGTVPHSMAVSLMKSRGLLLVFAGRSLFTRPSKISDYLAVQRPILGLAAEESETAHHVLRFGHWLYAGNSPEELAGVITRIWQTHRNDGPAPEEFPFPYPHPLNWRTIALTLAAVLDRICNVDASDAVGCTDAAR